MYEFLFACFPYYCGAEGFTAEKLSEGVLKVSWNDKAVIFDEEKITIFAEKMHFYKGNMTASIEIGENVIEYKYKDNQYRLAIENGKIIPLDSGDIEIIVENDRCMIYPEKQL